MNRSHVIRLNAMPEQEIYFRKACPVKRHAFNWALARWKEAREKVCGSRCKTSRRSATISYRAGWWFVSIAVELEHETPHHSGGTVGIDLGIKTLAMCSDGERFENQKHYRRNLGRIQDLSKGLSRKVEGSQNWWKQSKELAKAHYGVACQRQDTLHKMSTHRAKLVPVVAG